MKNEKINEKISEQNLEKVTGGLNTNHLEIGGYADTPKVEHPIMNDNVDAEDINPIMHGEDKPVATHPVIKGMLGEPTLIDTNKTRHKLEGFA